MSPGSPSTAATDVASVAIRVGEQTMARSVRRAQRQHAAQIVPLVHQVLALPESCRCEQIAGVIVGDGPGSFTGLRIGWAAAKGFLQERRRPLNRDSSLLGAAHAAGVETGCRML